MTRASCGPARAAFLMALVLASLATSCGPGSTQEEAAAVQTTRDVERATRFRHETEPPDATWTDPDTGCEYLIWTANTDVAVPRLARDGGVRCPGRRDDTRRQARSGG